MSILLMTGTVTGNAWDLSLALKLRMEAMGLTVVHPEVPELSDVQNHHQAVLVCTSTTGHGDIPDELGYLCAMMDRTPPRALAGRAYGVIGLGDESYVDSFCAAAVTLDAQLADLGGRQVCPPLLINTSEWGLSRISEPALAWLETWLLALKTTGDLA